MQMKGRERWTGSLVVCDLHVAVLLNPELSHDDVVHTARRIRPRICFIVFKKLQYDGSFGFCFYALPPELQFGIDWAMKDMKGQGGLACCSPWGCKESDMTERLNWTERFICWSLTSSVMVSEGGVFGRESGLEGGVPMNGVNVLINETKRVSSSTFHHVWL